MNEKLKSSNNGEKKEEYTDNHILPGRHIMHFGLVDRESAENRSERTLRFSFKRIKITCHSKCEIQFRGHFPLIATARPFRTSGYRILE